MRKIKFMALVAIICLLSLFTFTSCLDSADNSTGSETASETTNETVSETGGETDSESGSSGEEETLAAPAITLSDDFSVVWTAVDGATGYKVNVNGSDLNETTALSFSALKVAGSHEIKVKAVKGEKESEYSKVVKYSVHSVSLAAGEGFELSGEKIVYGGKDYTFALEIKGAAYQESNPVVKVNGTKITKNADGKYTVKNVAANLEITVEGVVKTEFAVTKPAGEGFEFKGAEKVVYGENYVFEVAKAVGFDQSTLTVKVNDEVVPAGTDGKYTVENVAANLVITVEGATKNVYSVTLPQSVAYVITGGTTVTHGSDYTFVLEIAEKYDKTNLVVKANETVLQAGDDGKTYTVASVAGDVTITIEGLNIIKYTVTLTDGTGYVLTGEAEAEHGGKYTFALEISEGYTQSVPVVKVNGEVNAGEDGKYTVENVTENLVVTVEGVAVNTYTVTVAQGAGFTAEVTSKTVNHGEDAGFVIAPVNEEDVIRVCNGEDVVAYEDGAYVVKNVTANVELTVKVYDLANQILLASSWDSYDGTTIAESKDGITVRGWQFGISAEYFRKVIEKGYTHLRFEYTTKNHSDETPQGVYMEGQGTAYQKCYPGQGSARFDLTMFKKEDNTYAKIWMQGKNSEAWADAKDIAITVTSAALFKSEETAQWTKSNPKVYCAVEENGHIVLDTIYCGNDAHVVTSAEWWAKYANVPNAALEQRTVIIRGRYLNVGSNSLGFAFGTKGVLTSHSEMNGTEFMTNYIRINTYDETDCLYFGLDKEGIYSAKFVDYVSSRNHDGGFSIDFEGEDSYKVTMPDGGKLIFVSTADYIAKGYKTVTITVSGNHGVVWIGNDTWGGDDKYIDAINDSNGWTNTLNLDDPRFSGKYFTMQFTGASDLIVTVTFGK